MADQATMTNGPDAKIHAPFTEGVIGNVAEFGNDTLELAELQVKLARLDFQDFASRSLLFAVSAGLGILILFGLVPVALAGIAAVLSETIGISVGLAMLLTAACAAIVAALLGWIGLRGLKRSLSSFDRSLEELTRNVTWIRTVLSNPARARPAGKGRDPGPRSRSFLDLF